MLETVLRMKKELEVLRANSVQRNGSAVLQMFYRQPKLTLYVIYIAGSNSMHQLSDCVGEIRDWLCLWIRNTLEQQEGVAYQEGALSATSLDIARWMLPVGS